MLSYLSQFKRALGFVWDSSRRWTLARVGLMVVQGGLPLVSLYLTKFIIDTVSSSLTVIDQGAAFAHIMLLLVLSGLVTLIMTMVRSLSTLIQTIQAQRMTDYMGGILHAQAVAVDLESYENTHYYDKLQRAQQEAPKRPTQVLDRLTQIGQSSISLVVMVGLLLTFHWGLAGILFVVAIPTVLVRLKFADILYRWQHKRTPIRRRANYFSRLLTQDRPAKEIRLFNLGPVFMERFHRLRRQLLRERVAIARRQTIANFAAQLIVALVILAAYGYIIYRTLQGSLTLGDLVLYHQAFKRGQGEFQRMLEGWSQLHAERLFLNDLYDFLDLQPQIVDPPQPQVFPSPMCQGVVFDRVNFQYGTTERQALKDVSFCIRPGETVALVGENGSGKTTLIKLLCRFYDPSAGTITIDGIDLRQFSLPDLRGQISVIFQDYMQYHLTAMENIWVGNVELDPKDEILTKAAFHAGAHELISTLPQGYNTMLGKRFDQGEELSIGQWQKIALARAFLRKVQILILDEPTSAMDPKAEYEVFQKFHQLTQGQTSILISHRLSTVKMADRILVMDQGSMVEQGTHPELLQLGGLYAHLFETQAQNYR